MKTNFYILAFAELERILLLTCQLVESLMSRTQAIHIHVTDQATAKKLDHMLWTYKDISFIPHRLSNEPDHKQPITIGYEQLSQQQETLINLNANLSVNDLRFQQIYEIVSADTHAQQSARDRFKQYRKQNVELFTHKIKTPSEFGTQLS